MEKTWEAKLECVCSTKSHMVVLEYDQEWGMCIHVQANQFQSFFKRVWVALRFVFGVRRGYSFWDNTILKKEDAVKVKEWLALAEKNGYGIAND